MKTLKKSFLVILLVFSFLLSGCSNRTEAMDKPEPDPYDEHIPFDTNVDNLPQNYQGNNIVEIFFNMSKDFDNPEKDEYETTTDYNSRIENGCKKYSGLVYAFALQDLYSTAEDKRYTVDTQYDADKQILSIKDFELNQSPENGDCFCNYSLPIRGDSDDGNDISTYEIWQLGLESEFDDTEFKNYLSKGININPSEAKQLDNDIGVLIICSPVNVVKPLAILSIDDRYITKGDTFIKRTLNVNINSIWLYEKSTGKIIYKSEVS